MEDAMTWSAFAQWLIRMVLLLGLLLVVVFVLRGESKR